MPRSEAARIADHYSRVVAWFRKPDQDEQRTKVWGVFYEIVRTAEALERLTFACESADVVSWLRRAGWHKGFTGYEIGSRARAILDSNVFDLWDLAVWSLDEEPYPHDESGDGCSLALWSDVQRANRPAIDGLLRDGVVDQEWGRHWGEIADGFRQLAEECRRMHEDVGAARGLLFAGCVMCAELLTCQRLFQYAFHRHADANAVAESRDPKALLAMERALRGGRERVASPDE